MQRRFATCPAPRCDRPARRSLLPSLLFAAACGGEPSPAATEDLAPPPAPPPPCQSRAGYAGLQEIVSCDDAGRLFGSAVALSRDGRTALIGAPPLEPLTQPGNGAAYLFSRDDAGTWTQQQVLVQPGCTPMPANGGGQAGPPGPAADCDASFGMAVALSADGKTVLVGARAGTPSRLVPPSNAAVAHVYERDGSGAWVEQKPLKLFTTQEYNGNIVNAITMSGDGKTLLSTGSGVGCQAEALVRGATGKAEPIKAAIQTARLWAVALSGDGRTALIGADGAGDPPQSGAAYVFTRDTAGTWTQEQRLIASDGGTGDLFGGAVSLSEDGNTALVASRRDGSVYVYTRAQKAWTQRQKLLGGASMLYGTAVALSGDGKRGVLAMQRVANNGLLLDGSVAGIKLEGTAWQPVSGLLPGIEVQNGDQLGAAVALSGDGSRVLLGAPRRRDAEEVGRGSVFVLTVK